MTQIISNMAKTIFKKDLANKKIIVTRAFSATPVVVWQAWTDSKILDQWWAPKPWKAKTKFMDFRDGGYWLYVMQGPEGEESWGRADFKNIIALKSYEATDSFCDEHGNKTNELPSMTWKNTFTEISNGTEVEIEITFSSQADLEKIVEMGFEEGFTSAHGNLDDLLAKLN